MKTRTELNRYARAVMRRLWLVLALGILVAALFYVRASSRPPRHTATTTLMVTTQTLFSVPTTTATQGNNNPTGSKSEANMMNSIIRLFSSRPIADRVAPLVGIEDPADVQKAIQAVKIPGTNLILIRATTGDRELSARIVNAAAQEFVRYFQEANRKDARDVRLFIEQQLAQNLARIEAVDGAIESYKVRSSVVSLDTAMSQAAQDLADIHKDQLATRVRLAEDDAKLAAAAARLGKESYTRVTIQDVENNPVFLQLQTALTNLQLQQAELTQRYTAVHPKLAELTDQIAEVRRQLTLQARRILGKQQTQVNPIHDRLLEQIADLQVDRAAAVAKLRALATLERRQQRRVLAIPEVERKLTDLLRERTVLQQGYSTLSARYLDALLRENEAGYVPAGVHIMDVAMASRRAQEPNLPVRTAMGLLVGLLLGLVAVVFLESSDDRIRSVQDAERTLGAPVLARVPDMTPRRAVPATGITVLIAGLVVGGLLAWQYVDHRIVRGALSDVGATISVAWHKAIR